MSERSKTMKKAIVAIMAIGLVFGLGGMATAVTIETVTVGNSGNAADPNHGGHGAVAYEYEIGQYEVTAGQYTEFLNDVAATDDYALWDGNMASTGTGNSTGSGITRSGGIGTYSYAVTGGFENRPVTHASWYDAVRFANWMTGGATETGSYTITGGGADSGTVAIPNAAQRATWAAGSPRYWLVPSEDEWYKAAYYDPAGPTWYDYPNGSDTIPTATTVATQLNATPGSANYDNKENTTTIVGSYADWPTRSPYGTYDQAGNMNEWTELFVPSEYRSIRGGHWTGGASDVPASKQGYGNPTVNYKHVGFRVSAVGAEGVPVPEPAGLGLIGLTLLVVKKRRR